MQAVDEISNLRDSTYSQYSQRIAHHPTTQVQFPGHQVLTNLGATENVTTCCAIILFNDTNQYVLGHYNSIEYQTIGQLRSLFTDELPDILHTYTPTQAILIGGDTQFFGAISQFLASHNIGCVASYLDHAEDSGLDECLYMKYVVFDPDTHKATVYSAALPEGKIELTDRHLTLDDDFAQHAGNLRTLTQRYYAEVIDEATATPTLSYVDQRFSFSNPTKQSPDAKAEKSVSESVHRKVK
ncbi:MAG: hypothetical protein A3J38_02280 [Gammaproteobacteria bacterium RIFCSPHIGHO2_12_FULL_45_9]|nr:MAG: hypothetical protein A3J38_02280 [Gammaproteobacteria bacterium RIFCSPHIGHO2_12_FULL_45_9]